jgi:hypothetical protein
MTDRKEQIAKPAHVRIALALLWSSLGILGLTLAGHFSAASTIAMYGAIVLAIGLACQYLLINAEINWARFLFLPSLIGVALFIERIQEIFHTVSFPFHIPFICYPLQIVALAFLCSKGSNEWFRAHKTKGIADLSWFILTFLIVPPCLGYLAFVMGMGAVQSAEEAYRVEIIQGLITAVILGGIAWQAFRGKTALLYLAIIASALVSFSLLLISPMQKLQEAIFFGEIRTGQAVRAIAKHLTPAPFTGPRREMDKTTEQAMQKELDAALTVGNYQEEPFSPFDGLPPMGLLISFDVHLQKPLAEFISLYFDGGWGQSRARVKCSISDPRRLNYTDPYSVDKLNPQDTHLTYFCCPSNLKLANKKDGQVCISGDKLAWTDEAARNTRVINGVTYSDPDASLHAGLTIDAPDNDRTVNLFGGDFTDKFLAALPAGAKLQDVAFWQSVSEDAIKEDVFTSHGFHSCAVTETTHYTPNNYSEFREKFEQELGTSCYCK